MFVHLIKLIFWNFLLMNRALSKVLFDKLIFEIFDFKKAKIIEGATPPAPKIRTFLFFFSGVEKDFKNAAWKPKTSVF